MNNSIKNPLLIFLLSISIHVSGQKLKFGGYIKDIQTIDLTNLDTVTVQNQIHNRLNFNYKITDNFKITLEVRNRLFYGNFKNNPSNFIDELDQQNDFFQLSKAIISRDNFLLYSILDRANLEWHKNNFEVKFGRQRINWGVNLFWNPNDFFNAYSLYDFDYEERPGSDALLLRYYTGVASNIETAVKIADDFEESTFAGMWKINKWDYDFQFIVGKMKQDVVSGIGWAGNIANAGFKGEFSYFYSYEDTLKENAVAFSIGSDYSFSEKFYFNGEVLFNSSGKNKINLIDFNRYIYSTLTSKNLSPTKFSVAFQPVFNFNPKYSASCSIVLYLGEYATYLSPVFTTHIKDNLDLNLIGQIIVSDITGKYKINNSLLSVRFKWCF